MGKEAPSVKWGGSREGPTGGFGTMPAAEINAGSFLLLQVKSARAATIEVCPCGWFWPHNQGAGPSSCEDYPTRPRCPIASRQRHQPVAVALEPARKGELQEHHAHNCGRGAGEP